MHKTLAALVLATSSLASAAPEPRTARTGTSPAVALVEAQLVEPLAAKERDHSRFSRARQPATARRVRVLDAAPQRDSAGNAFVRFTVDEKLGWFGDDAEDHWSKDKITGCAYVDSREVFVKRGNAFHPAASRMGKKTKAAAASVCNPASRVVAR